MASNVNVTIGGFQTTGSNVNFPQYEVDITINWNNNTGEPQARSQTVLFPNILNDPSISNAWLKEHLMDLMLEALREIAGVDSD